MQSQLSTTTTRLTIGVSPFEPESLLTTRIVTGWAPGSSDGTANGSPVWITAPAATRIYVDFGNASPGPLIDPNGDAYDVHFDINAYDQVRVYDPDLDQTGLAAYTLDGTVVSAAWGQDPAVATPFNPYLDLGTSIFPFTALSVAKSASLVNDVNGNGLVEPGDQLEYLVSISDAGNLALLSVVMNDPVPANTSYVPSTTTVDGASVADDTVPPAATGYPFDETGYSLGTINPGQTVLVRFRVQIESGLLPSVASVINEVTVTANNTSGRAAVETPVVVPDLSITKSSSVTGSVRAGDTITYTIDIENTGSLTHNALLVNDPAPIGTSWVSTTVTGPVVSASGNVRDEFNSASYSLNDGSNSWVGNWIETDSGPPQSPTGGDIQIVTNQSDARLRIKDNDLAIERTADMSAYNSATLSYSFRRVNLDNGNDWVAVFIDDGTTRTEIARYDGSVVSSDAGYTTVTHDVSAYVASGTTLVSFESSPSLGNNDVVYFDDVDITGETRTVQTYPGTAPDLVVSGADLRFGETMSIVIVVTVDNPVAPGVTSIDNAATVYSDVETAGQTAFASNALERVNDLVLTKSDSPDPVLAGEPLTYTIGITNNGPDVSTGSVVTDTLPANVTFVSATPSQGSCSESAGIVACSLGDIAISGAATITIVVAPTAAAAGTRITNSATASADPTELVPADNTDTEDTDVLAAANLSVAKTDSIDPALAGVGYTYTVTVTNAGPNSATSVVMTDSLPAGVAFSSATPDQGSCSEAGGVVTCTLGSIASGASVDVNIVAVAGAAVENTTVSNNASVTSAIADPDTADNSTSEDTDIDPAADLNITKSDDVDPVLVNDNLTYTITVLNEGVSGATTVIMTDVLPSGVTFVSATPDQGSCSESSGTVTCSIGSMAALASIDVVIVVTPGPALGGTTITNSASVTAAEADPDSSDSTITEDTDVDPKADLSLAKTASPDPVLAGESITYTLTVSNAGPSPSAGSTITDVLPPGAAFNAGSSSATCSESGGTVTCTVGAIAVGGSAGVTVVVDVDPSVALGATLTNAATVTGDDADPNSTNDSGDTTVTVDTEADLSIVKIDSIDPVLAGNGLSYTVTVTNNGPSDAQLVAMSDTLPAGVNYVSVVPSTGSCTFLAGVVDCAFGTVAPGASVSAVIAVVVPSDTASGTTLTNDASTSTTTTDPTVANDSTSEETTVATSADVSIAKTDSTDPVNAGDPLTYTLTVDNAGPSDALMVVASDTLPAEVTYGSSSTSQGSCSEAGGVVTCALGTIVSGGSVTITINVIVDSDVADGSTITNNASVTSATTDPSAANNSTSEDTTTGTNADLSITKSDSPDTVVAGTGLAYTIGVSNAGPSDAQAVTVSDTLPAGLAYVGSSTTQGSCSESSGTVTCLLGIVADGGSVTITINVTVNPDVADGSSILNTASVSSTTSDPVAGNNSASSTTSVTTSADISVVKTDSVDPVTAGNNLTYTLAVSNDGPSNAQSVSVTDILPAGVSYVSYSIAGGSGGESCLHSAGIVTCSLGSVADGTTETITVVVTVDPSTVDGASLLNSVAISTTTSDPDTLNDSDAETTAVATSADLAVTKADSADPVNAGSGFFYVVTVANAGPSDARTVVLTDALPVEVSFVSATPDQGLCSESGGTVTCTLGMVAAGGSADVVITVAVLSDAAAGTITNTASVSSATSDPVAGNDSTSEDTTVATSANLSVVKVDSADPVNAGSGFSYTVTVANAGPSDAQTVVLTDVLPVEVSFVSATPDQGSCSESGGTVTCTLGMVAAGGSADVVITVTVLSDAAAGTITNTASVSSATSDPVAGTTTLLRTRPLRLRPTSRWSRSIRPIQW